MNKIDLIIDNIMYAKIIKEGAHQDELLEEALTAARELRELKPEWWVNPDDGSMVSQYSMTHCADTLKDKYTIPLYALDEVTK
jgi:hypothetical protein